MMTISLTASEAALLNAAARQVRESVMEKLNSETAQRYDDDAGIHVRDADYCPLEQAAAFALESLAGLVVAQTSTDQVVTIPCGAEAALIQMLFAFRQIEVDSPRTRGKQIRELADKLHQAGDG